MIKPGKVYKLFKANVYTSKKGNPYLRASICDSERQPDGTYKENGWFNVLIFTNADEIYSAGKVQISAINGVEKKVNDYNGKRYENYSLVIEGTAATSNRGCKPDYESAMYDYKQPTQGERSLNLEPISDDGDLPF